MSGRDDELLGGLPRSRPGRRSERRGAAPDSSDPEGPGGARTPPDEHGPPLADDADVEVAAGGDPLAGAVRVAGNLARTGLRAAGGVLRRLPGRR